MKKIENYSDKLLMFEVARLRTMFNKLEKDTFEGKEGKWVTLENGQHIFIREGESLQDALGRVKPSKEKPKEMERILDKVPKSLREKVKPNIEYLEEEDYESLKEKNPDLTRHHYKWLKERGALYDDENDKIWFMKLKPAKTVEEELSRGRIDEMTLLHEYGHAVDRYYGEKLTGEKQNRISTQPSADFYGGWLEYNDHWKGKGPDGNPKEWFAESFVGYLTTTDDKKAAVRIRSDGTYAPHGEGELEYIGERERFRRVYPKTYEFWENELGEDVEKQQIKDNLRKRIVKRYKLIVDEYNSRNLRWYWSKHRLDQLIKDEFEGHKGKWVTLEGMML